MNHPISLSEFVTRFATPDGNASLELHATLEARYDSASHTVIADLDAYVCPDDASHMQEHARPAWLPPAQTVRAGGSAEETSAIARDIFHSWVRQVRTSLPASP